MPTAATRKFLTPDTFIPVGSHFSHTKGALPFNAFSRTSFTACAMSSLHKRTHSVETTTMIPFVFLIFNLRLATFREMTSLQESMDMFPLAILLLLSALHTVRNAFQDPISIQ